MNANPLTRNKATSSGSGSGAAAPPTPPPAAPTESPRGEDDFEGRVKTRLLSMWNNMKYGWTLKTKTNFSKESPVWLLGRCYHKKCDASEAEPTEMATDIASQGEVISDEDEGIEAFKLDFVSRLWLTYRREFPILDGSTFSSDCGWGCMLRSGQMLLAQALVVHLLGRDWRWQQQAASADRESYVQESTHRAIVRWFGDRPSHNSPLSIHNLVLLGTALGKQPGDWYGPAFVAHLLRKAVREAARENAQLARLNVYVAQDCCVYIQDVVDECEHAAGWKSLVVLVPVRLGADKFNYLYAPCLTTLLSHENCIGIIGGRPKHSLYFVGYQDDKLIHLDPHYCQEMVDVWASGFPLTSFHCRSPRKMHLSKMDPSCCIGFYCATRRDFFNFVASVQPYLLPPSRPVEYPMFVFSDGRCEDALQLQLRPPPSPPPYPPSVQVSKCSRCVDDQHHDECEEFEIL